MNGRSFVDSNIAIYALDPISFKGETAIAILQQRPIISTQVVMETLNVVIKKLKFSRTNAFKHARFLLHNSVCTAISKSTLELSFEIASKYDYSHWDCLIIASALEADCNTLYSEDLQDGQKIGQLTIHNPFKEAR
jgi:predicted nucleic acid-binding protein